MENLTQPIIWENNSLKLIDQRILPHEKNFIEYNTMEETFHGIRDMVVRGAPCIGFTAIFGMALWCKENADKAFVASEFDKACDYLITSRPTAVNLEYEVNRCREIIKSNIADGKSINDCFTIISKMGIDEIQKAYETNRKMAGFFCDDLHEIYGPTKLKVLTHCNTGTLACGTIGTALGAITVLNEREMLKKVWVDETRPYLQGSRLTAFELVEQGIDHDIVVEGAASYLMRNGLVDAIVTGADRIALNGDTANKVGTSNLAIIANHYNIPFYVIAPLSSIDLSLKSGDEIKIELRDPNEILKIKDQQIAPIESSAYNPSFDITDAKLIKGIICEEGLFKGSDGLGALVK